MGSSRLATGYWQEYLQNAKQCYLSDTSGRSGVRDTNESLETIDVPFGNAKLLQSFSEEHRIEKGHIFRLAWMLVLGRYTDLEEVCFCVHEKRRGDTLSGICRMQINPTDTLAEVLTKVQADGWRSSYFHIDLLQDTLLAAGGPNLPEICNSAIVEDHGQRKDIALESTDYDIAFCVGDSESLFIEHQPSAVSTDLALRIAHTFGKTLSSILCAEMSDQLLDLEMLGDKHMEQIAVWNASPIEGVKGLVHEMVEKQAREFPDHEAVCSWDGSLTYRELSQLSSRLALYLKDLGVGPNIFVVLGFNKSKWNVVANLAVLKAGGACASVDPLHPPSRLDKIVHDTKASVALTEADLARIFQDTTQHVVVVASCLYSELPHNQTTEEYEYTCDRVQPADAAFVLFTSGSTGQPKGIVQQHGAYCTSVVESASVFASGPGPEPERRRHLQYAAHTFDNSVSDMFVTLAYGGCVCVPHESDRLDPAALVTVMEKMRVNQAELTPTVARMLRPEEVPSLEVLALTGEAATAETIKMWTESVGTRTRPLHLLNIYGPAEIAILSTVKPALRTHSHPLDVGFPVGGHCWITDPHNHHRLAPLGAVGELLLEGPFLAQGYLNDPEKTKAVFIENPEWARPNDSSNFSRSGLRRMYRTGDLARYNLDGSIRLVGRNETHIKLRGQRIELAGVEHQLCASSEVQHGAVLFPEVGLCAQTLVAVLSFHHLPIPNPSPGAISRGAATPIVTVGNSETVRRRLSTVKGYLGTSLPVYMIPTVWLVIESFPVLSSGKLDRKYLKAWLQGITETQVQQARELVHTSRKEKTSDKAPPPHTEIEKLLLRLCARILNLQIESIDLEDSFFRLGGDSISAMSLRAKCRSEGNFLITVQDVLRSNNLGELARRGRFVGRAKPRIDATELCGTLFDLSPIQRIFFHASPEGGHEYTQSFLLKSRAHVPHGTLESAFEVLVERHSMLRAQFHCSTPKEGWRQLIQSYRPHLYHLNVHYNTSMLDLSHITASPWTPLNIRKGPVFSAHICEMSNSEEQVIFLTAHHLVVDLVSWRILLEDLENIIENIESTPSRTAEYQNQKLGDITASNHLHSQHDLPRDIASQSNKSLDRATMDVPLSFQTWTKMQSEYLKRNTPSNESADVPLVRTDWEYWGMENVLNLFGDAESMRYSLSETTTRALLGDCNLPLKTEPIDILFGVTMHAFHQAFPDRPIPTFFNESHGREAFDESLDLSTVGWFTTMFPVSIQIDWTSPIDTIRRAKEIRQSFPDRGWRWFSSMFLDSAENCAMEVIFNYFGMFQQVERKDALLTPMDSMAGAQPSEEGGPRMPRPSLLEVALSVDRGALQVNTTFNHRMRHRDRIRKWVKTSEHIFEEVARQMVKMEPQMMLDDVPLLRTSEHGLNVLRKVTLPALNVSIANVEDVYCCSPMQQGLLISSLQQPRYYLIRLSFEMSPSGRCKSLDPDRLQAAWQQLVHRHSILRTLLVNDICGDGLFGQIVLRSVVPKVTIIRRENAESARQASRDHPNFMHTMGKVPHQLLICSCASTGKLHCELDISHAVIDGISLSLLMRDLSLAYTDELPSLAGVPYRAILSYIQDLDPRPSLEYWIKHLANVKPCHITSVAYGADEDPVLLQLQVPLDDNGDVRAFCKVIGVTTTTFLHTAWLLVLQCYTGLDLPCFGYLSSGRDLSIAGIQDVVGPCINMLVCCKAISGEQEVKELLHEVQNDMHEGMAHQTSSLSSVQHALGVSGPLFNTVMTQEQHFDTIVAGGSGISVEVSEVYDPTEYALAVHVHDSGEVLSVQFEYWNTIMTCEQATNIAHTFAKVLSSVVADVVGKVQDLEKCSSLDTNRIGLLNQSSFPTVDACIHHLIRDRAELHPRSEAICSWDGAMTYAELDFASGQFARYILQMAPCTQPDSFIPLCFHKTLWQPVAMLAALKTGAAFVALEPEHPKQRLRSIVSKLRARTILCSSQYLDMCLELADLVIVIDESRLVSLAAGRELWDVAVTPSNAAYAIFTSGSTGTPKGAIIEHKAYASNVAVHQRQLHMGNTSRALQFASYAFDAFVLESLTTLAVGGCICIPNEEERMNNVGGAMRRMGVTWSLLTPSFAGLLDPSEVPSLKVLVCGGETLSNSVLQKWAPAVVLCNAYGPSECSVSSVINAHVTEATSPTNIGRGAGALTWIVDAANHDNLVPVGSLGELLLEGPILGHGYVDEKEKTDAVFIYNPKWTLGMTGTSYRERRRFYKTGDICKYSPNGDISYVGRKDTQVKIHGQRLEIGEIEHHLANAPHVKLAVVTYPKAGLLQESLVATLTLDDLPRPPIAAKGFVENIHETPRILQAVQEASEIRDYLDAKLPGYMVPKTIIPVENIPLSAAGKLDRRQVENYLTGITDERRPRAMTVSNDTEVLSKSFTVPSTRKEKHLQSIWSQILNVRLDRIWKESSFLRLGGDSISALQLVSKCRREGLGVSVQDVLVTKTLMGLAQKVTVISTPLASETKINEESDADFELSPIQRLYFDLAPRGDNHFTQSFFLRCKRKVDVEDLSRALAKLVGVHGMLRARFKIVDQWRQCIPAMDSRQDTNLESRQVSSLEDAKVFAQNARKRLRITSGPVYAVEHFVLGETQYIYLTAHHLVLDLVSWRIILEDLDGLLQDDQHSPAASASYQTWCREQRLYASRRLTPDVALPSALRPRIIIEDYWEMSGQPNRARDCKAKSFVMDLPETEMLLGSCNDVFSTKPIELFHACVLHSFHLIFGRLPTVFHEGHGRESFNENIDLSRTVGWFTSLYPVAVSVEEPQDLFVCIRNTKDHCRSIPGNGWPYFASRFLNPDGICAFGDLTPEILLNYHGRFQQLERQDAVFEQLPLSDLIDSDDDPEARRVSLIDLEISVLNQRLRVHFSYNKHMKHQERLEKWIERCQISLGDVAAHHKRRTPQRTLSDFPLFRGDYRALESVIRVVSSERTSGQPLEIQDIYSCSPMQHDLLKSQGKGLGHYQGMWLWVVTYKDPKECAPLDASRLQRAWEEVVRRHDLLRTTFVQDKARPDIWFQVVLKNPRISVSIESETEIARLTAFQTQPPVDYSKYEPLHRLHICKASASKLVCRMEISHAITDGTAMEVLLGDWIQAYSGVSGLPSSEALPYADYLRYLFTNPRPETQDYWRSYLGNIVPCIFPVSAVPPLDRPFLPKSVNVSLSPTLDIATFCETHEVTAASLIRTIWAVALHHYTHSPDVCFGYTVYGRDVPLDQTLPIPGPLFNFLPYRATIKASQSILELLHATQRDYVAGLPYQVYSFPEARETLDLPEIKGKRPFNTLINHRRAVADVTDQKGQEPLALRFEEVLCRDPMDYVFVLEVTQLRSMEMKLSFWDGEVDTGTAESVSRLLEALVVSFVKYPEKSVAEMLASL